MTNWSRGDSKKDKNHINNNSNAGLTIKPTSPAVDFSFDERSGQRPWASRPNTADSQRSRSSVSGIREFSDKKGYTVKRHPPSLYTYGKSHDYQKELEEDLQKLYAEEQIQKSGSPSWAGEVSQQSNHSGESPLFVHNYLASSKIEQQYGSQKYPKNPLHTSKFKSPPSRSGVQYYRPNSTHQYLTATELKNSSKSHVNMKLGRPTRTTLLRARQRCNSAPSCESRREQLKRAEEKATDIKKILNSRELFSINVPDGETLHSFLIGARYNRAHCLDAKSLLEQGVYMPRNNPLGCFVIPKSARRDRPHTAPSAAPASPASVVSESDNEAIVFPDRPSNRRSSPPSTPVSSPTGETQPASPSMAMPLKEAWSESPGKEPQRHAHFRPPMKDNAGILEVHNLDESLNVKGKSYSGHSGRPKSAAPHLEHNTLEVKQTHLPLVTIQGTTIIKVEKKSKDAIQQTVMANEPVTLSHIPVPEVREALLKNDGVESTDVQETPKIQKVDKSFNVPSLPGDMSHIEDLVIISSRPKPQLTEDKSPKDKLSEDITIVKQPTSRPEGDYKEEILVEDNDVDKHRKIDKKETQPVPVIKQGGSHLMSALKGKKSKVRFADSIIYKKTECADVNAPNFFITEDERDEQPKQIKLEEPVQEDRTMDYTDCNDNDRNFNGKLDKGMNDNSKAGNVIAVNITTTIKSNEN